MARCRDRRRHCVAGLAIAAFTAAVIGQGGVAGQGVSVEEIASLAEQMVERHWDLFHSISPEDFEAAVADLAARSAASSDVQLWVDVARLAASVGDGHTRLWLNRPSATGFGELPIRLYRFSDGWYVRAAPPSAPWALGRRLDSIGDAPIDEAVRAVAELIGQDNPNTALAVAADYLVIPEVLFALGLTEAPDRVRFELASEAGEPRLLELDRVTPEAFAGVDIDAGVPGSIVDAVEPGASALVTTPASERPAWVEDGPDLGFRLLPAERAMYVRMLRVAQGQDEELHAFVRRTVGQAVESGVDRYVLDLRRAWGGNNQLALAAALELVHSDFDEPGRLWVLIGRHTFSATMSLVTLLDRMTSAIFVGEPTGGRPNYYADARPARLPGKGIVVGVSSLYWQDSDPWDDREWFAPDVAIELSVEEYLAGVDPVLGYAVGGEVPADPRPALRRLVSVGDLGAAGEVLSGFRGDPRNRYRAETLVPSGFALALGDELIESGDIEGARHAYILAILDDPGDEVAGSRAGWFSSADSLDPGPVPAALDGRYGPYVLRREGPRYVLGREDGPTRGLRRLLNHDWLIDGDRWTRVRVADDGPHPSWIEIVSFDGSTSRFSRR